MGTYQSNVNQLLGMAGFGATALKRVKSDIFQKKAAGAERTAGSVTEQTQAGISQETKDVATEARTEGLDEDVVRVTEEAGKAGEEAAAAERARIERMIAEIRAGRPESIIEGAAYDKEHPIPSMEEIERRVQAAADKAISDTETRLSEELVARTEAEERRKAEEAERARRAAEEEKARQAAEAEAEQARQAEEAERARQEESARFAREFTGNPDYDTEGMSAPPLPSNISARERAAEAIRRSRANQEFQQEFMSRVRGGNE